MEFTGHDRRASRNRSNHGRAESGSVDGAMMRNRTDDLIDMSVSIAAVLFVIMLALVMASVIK